MLIVIEGIDGSGKSTHARLLADYFESKSRKVVVSHEPTSGPFGQKLRDSAFTGRLSPDEELELFLADRRHHLENLVNPALENGEVVILDRYYFSTMAYQGARGFDPQAIKEMNEKFAPRPDFLFILDIPIDLALDRIGIRDGQANAFEKKEDLLKCQEIFKAITGDYVTHIDSSQSMETVHDLILKQMDASSAK